MAQLQIPIGTAYAVWTGIGAAGTHSAAIEAPQERSGRS
nr:SMR family transporter [Roseomonas marmotae]